MKKVKITAITAAMMAASLVFTGCGSQTTEKAESEAPSVMATTETTTTPAQSTESTASTMHISDTLDSELEQTLDEEMQKLMQDDEIMETTPSDKYRYMSIATITENGQSMTIPVVNTNESFSVGMNATGYGNGVYTQAQLMRNISGEENFVANKTAFEVENTCIALEGTYKNVRAGEMVTGIDSSGAEVAINQVNFTTPDLDGTDKESFEIIKVVQVSDDYYVLLSVRVNNTLADEQTEAVFKEVCQAYGIDFEANR